MICFGVLFELVLNNRLEIKSVAEILIRSWNVILVVALSIYGVFMNQIVFLLHVFLAGILSFSLLVSFLLAGSHPRVFARK